MKISRDSQAVPAPPPEPAWLWACTCRTGHAHFGPGAEAQARSEAEHHVLARSDHVAWIGMMTASVRAKITPYWDFDSNTYSKNIFPPAE